MVNKKDDIVDEMKIAVEPGVIIVNDKAYLLKYLSATLVEEKTIDMKDAVDKLVDEIKKKENRKRLTFLFLSILSILSLAIPDDIFYSNYLHNFLKDSMNYDVGFLHGLVSTFFAVRFALKAWKKKPIVVDQDAYVSETATLNLIFDYDANNSITFTSTKGTIEALLNDINRNRLLKPCLEA